MTPAAKHRDESLRLRCAALRSFVSPAHLDLPDECDAPESAPHWELACFHLTELNRYRAPVDKCTCLTNACLLLSGMMAALKARRSAVAAVAAAAPSESDGDAETLQGGGAGVRSPGARQGHDGPVAAAAASGADDLLPALVLALLRSNPAHLASNVEYIRDYHAPDALRSEAGYYLTHVESAVAFLEGLCASHLTGVTAAEFEAVLTGASPPREGGSDQPASNAAPTGPVVAVPLQRNLREEEGGVASASATPNDGDALPATPAGGAASAEESRSVSVAIRGAMAQLETAAIPLPPVHTAGTEVAVSPLEDAEGSALDEDLCSRLPSRLLVLSPEELLGVLEPPPAADSAVDTAGTGSRGAGAADAIAGWLQQRLRFLQVHSAADLRLADLQPLLDEYRA